jgi:hypothetical protein
MTPTLLSFSSYMEKGGWERESEKSL